MPEPTMRQYVAAIDLGTKVRDAVKAAMEPLADEPDPKVAFVAHSLVAKAVVDSTVAVFGQSTRAPHTMAATLKHLFSDLVDKSVTAYFVAKAVAEADGAGPT